MQMCHPHLHGLTDLMSEAYISVRGDYTYIYLPTNVADVKLPWICLQFKCNNLSAISQSQHGGY